MDGDDAVAAGMGDKHFEQDHPSMLSCCLLAVLALVPALYKRPVKCKKYNMIPAETPPRRLKNHRCGIPHKKRRILQPVAGKRL